MVVILKMDTGDSIMLDRKYNTNDIVHKIIEGRNKDQLLEFQNNSTPSRTIFVDPDHVVVVKDDGYLY